MKYPKKRITDFIQFGEYDCRQVNLHQGKKYNYWFIQGEEKQPIKLLIGRIPRILKDKDIKELINFK